MKVNTKWISSFIGSILFVNYSMMFMELISATNRAILTIVILAIMFFYLTKRKNGSIKSIKIHDKIFLFAFLLVFLILISCTLNGFNLEYDLYTIFLIIISAILVNSIEKNIFYESYINSMSFFGLSGTLIYGLYRFFPSFFVFFPNHIWHGSISMKNCILCVVQTNSQYIRNYGVFYEPGMFSFFLIIAIYFSLFKTNQNIKKITILVIALLTTLSTNGYICLALLLIAFIFVNNQLSKKVKRRIILSFLCFVSIAIVFLVMNPASFGFLVGKFSEISFDSEVSMTETGSGYERWRSVILALEAIKTNPIFGVATVGWQRIFYGVIGTATPLNWFGLYGIFYGSLLNYYYLKSVIEPSKNGNKYIISAICIVAFIFNSISQNVSNNLIVLMIVFYSTLNKKNSIIGR